MHIIYVYKTRLLRFLTLHFVAFIRHCSMESCPTLINVLWKYCVNDCTYVCKNILQQPAVDILNTLWFISLCVSLAHILIIFLECLPRKQKRLCKARHGTLWLLVNLWNCWWALTHSCPPLRWLSNSTSLREPGGLGFRSVKSLSVFLCVS